MNVGFDYWNVLSHHPDYFRELVAQLNDSGHTTFVISAVGRKRAGTVNDEVRALEIPVRRVYEVVFVDPSQSPRLKTQLALKLGTDVFYDDRDDVCEAMTEAGILALRVTRPDRRKRGDVTAEQS